jgi:hypothetical protein
LGAVIADAPLILGTTRPKWSCPPNTHKHNISICVYIIYWINLFIHLCISTIYNIANIYIILHIYILYIYAHCCIPHVPAPPKPPFCWRSPLGDPSPQRLQQYWGFHQWGSNWLQEYLRENMEN